MLIKIIKLLGTVIALIFLSISIVIYLTAGDLLLDFLMSQIGLQIKYTNSVNFVDTFVFRNINLNNLELLVKNQPVSIKSSITNIDFDYNELFLTKGVGLECVFHNPKIDIKHNNNTQFLDFLPSSFFPVTGEISEAKFDKVYCKIVFVKGSVDIRQFNMFSKDIVLSLSGKLNRSGKNDVNLKIFISENLADKLPKETINLFENTKNNWKSFKMQITVDQSKKYLNVVSPRLRLEIGGANLD